MIPVSSKNDLRQFLGAFEPFVIAWKGVHFPQTWQ